MPFVPDLKTLLAFDVLARRYGGRPSDWLEYSLSSVWIDLQTAAQAIREEERQIQLAKHRHLHGQSR